MNEEIITFFIIELTILSPALKKKNKIKMNMYAHQKNVFIIFNENF